MSNILGHRSSEQVAVLGQFIISFLHKFRRQIQSFQHFEIILPRPCLSGDNYIPGLLILTDIDLFTIENDNQKETAPLDCGYS